MEKNQWYSYDNKFRDDISAKILILGGSRCGKTVFCRALIGLRHNMKYYDQTHSESLYINHMEIQVKVHNIVLIDMSDNEFSSQTEKNILSADAFIIVQNIKYNGYKADIEFQLSKNKGKGKINAPRVVVINSHRTEAGDDFDDLHITEDFLDAVFKDATCPIFISDPYDLSDHQFSDALEFLVQELSSKNRL